MHPNCEFIGLALPCAGVLRRRVIIAAGALAVLSGYAQSPATSGTDTPSARVRFFDYVKSYRDVSTYRDVAAVEKAEPETLLEARLQMDFNSLERQWDSFLIHI
jgi:hypothetical protein